MAEIYAKQSLDGADHCLILDVGQPLTYRTNVRNWREFIVAASLSVTTVDDPNANLRDSRYQYYPQNTPTTNFLFGLIEDPERLPDADNNFIGKLGHRYTEMDRSEAYATYAVYSDTVHATNQYSQSLLVGAYRGGLRSGKTVTSSPSNLFLRYHNHESNQYATLQALRFTVQSPGQANQQIAVYDAHLGFQRGRLTPLQETASAVTRHLDTIPWNIDGAALPLPNNVILYFPVSARRLRIHALYFDAY